MSAAFDCISQHPIAGPLVLCHPHDPRLARADYDRFAAAWEQDDCGPLMIVVGRQASDSQCEKIATRWDLNIAQVIAFRDTEDAEVQS